MTIDANEPRTGSHLGNAARRVLRARIGRLPVGGLLAAVAVAALLSAAYNLGAPPSDNTFASDQHSPMKGVPLPAASFGGNVDIQEAQPTAGSVIGAGGRDSTGMSVPASVDAASAPLDTTKIVKTGSMALEVVDLNKAVSQAQAAIVGMGGYVSQSSSSGDKTYASANVTYRLPAPKWDDALNAMRGLASRVINEQTSSTDVTGQIVDLDARLRNLNATESALQAIMARASAIPDVLAVQQQLTQTEGEIEQLTAQQKLLNDQADMSTLSVSFSTPGPTVATTTASEWDLGAQVDEAGAALIRIGQGLAAIVVWAVVVGVPLLVGLALLGGIWWIVRRGTRRRRPQAAPAA